MIKLGTTDITGIMLGSTEIVKAYLGTDVVYQNLPYDAEIEYLYLLYNSNDAPYINTGIKGSNNIRFDINVEFTNIGLARTGYLIGSRIGKQNKDITIFLKESSGASDNGIRWIFGNSQVIKNTNPSFDVAHNFNNLNIASTLLFDTTNVFSANNNNFANNLDMFVFAANNNGVVDKLHISAKLFSLSIYDGTTLVRDYIPVRVGTTGYMYDKVSKQLFGNAGTGDFILGPDVTE